MTHNDVLRSLRYLLDVNDVGMANLFELGGARVPLRDVAAFTLREDEDGFLACTDAQLSCFLDGLILQRRGPRDGGSARPPDAHVTNNTILKKLRVAFALGEPDLLDMMAKADFRVSKHELSALFRNPGHPNYRACGDQFLRNFLRSLTLRVRG